MNKLCSKCQVENTPEAKFCHNCGYQLAEKKCPNSKCGAPLISQPNFCDQCGWQLRFFCPNCKNEYSLGQIHCTKCGKQLPAGADYSGVTSKISPVIESSSNNSEKSRQSSENNNREIVAATSPRWESSPQDVVIPKEIERQYEDKIKPTEEYLELLLWNSQTLEYKRTLPKEFGDNLNYNKNRKVKTLWDQAIAYLNRKEPDYARALQNLNQIIVEMPNNFDTLFNAAICNKMMGNLNSAFEIFTNIRSLNPNSPEAMLGLLECSFLLRFWKTFLDTLRAYFAIAHNYDSRSHLLFMYELRFGFYENSLQTFKSLKMLPNYEKPSSITDYLTLIALRCLDDKNKYLFFRKISNDSHDLDALINLLQSHVKNKPTHEYRILQEKENEVLQSIKTKRAEVKSDELFEQRQKYIRENKADQAEKICNELVSLRDEQKTAKDYLNEGYVIEAKRLVNEEGKFLKASELLWRIPIDDRGDEWNKVNQIVVNNLSSYYRPQQRKGSKRIPITRDLTTANDVMREADKLAQHNPKAAIEVLINHDSKFLMLVDKTRKNNLLGNSYIRIGEYEKAKKCFQDILDSAQTTQQQISALFSLAILYRKQGDNKAAIDALNKIKNIDTVKTRKVYLETLLNKIKSEINRQKTKAAHTGEAVKEISPLDSDFIELSGIFGLAAQVNETSDFIKIEIEQTDVVGLGQKRIVTEKFILKDVEYLLLEARDLVKTNKPKLAAEHYISAVKVLFALNYNDDSRVPEGLRNFCAAKGDACVIENLNWDVARTYYAEVFRFSANFVYSQLDSFDSGEASKTQSEIKLSQFLSTFYRKKEAFLEKQNWPIYPLLEILQHGNEKVVASALKGLILLASYNAEVASYILSMARKNSTILNELCRHFSKIYDESASSANLEFLQAVIEKGVGQIRDVTTEIKSQFQFYSTNLASFAQLREKTPLFQSFSPSFKDVGVDYQDTDSRRLEEMKKILRVFASYETAKDFDEKESKQLTAVQYVNALLDEMLKSPTYWGRCYMQPILHKWKDLLEEDFKQYELQASPLLEIETVERTDFDRDNGRAQIHILISNSEGTKTGSGVKLHVLPSTENSYSPIKPEYEIGSVPVRDNVNCVIEIAPNTNEDRLTLSYRFSYDKKGQELQDEERTISVPLDEERFEEFDNPYTTWANSNIVTDEKMFKGRNAFVEEIVSTLQKVGRNKTIVIHGQKRSGKSSILYHVARRFQNLPHSNIVPVYLSLGLLSGESNEEIDPAKLFYAILQELEDSIHPKEIPSIPKLNELAENPVMNFLSYMKKFSRTPEFTNITPLLIIDEFTYLYAMIKKGVIGENFMHAWKAIIEQHLFSSLLAGKDDMPDFIKAYSNDFGATEPKHVGYLDDKGAKELIIDPIWNKNKDASRLQDSAVKKIVQLTASSPFYIQIIMDKLVQYMNHKKISRATRGDVNKVVEDYIKGLQHSVAPALFDNLTSYWSDQNTEAKLEMKVLQFIAQNTDNQQVYASQDSIFREFETNQQEKVEPTISRLLGREVLVTQPQVAAYKIKVELFKLWLNEKMPYERRN